MSAKVIAGFDGSNQSRDALRLARELADAEGAELHVAVVLPRSYNPFEEAVAGAPVSEQLDAQRFAGAERELGGGGHTKASLDGGLGGRSAARALRDYAEEQDASLIVVGSSHRGTLGRVLAGSASSSRASPRRRCCRARPRRRTPARPPRAYSGATSRRGRLKMSSRFSLKT